MTLIAIILALIANRLLSRFEHHREPRWFLVWVSVFKKINLPSGWLTLLIAVLVPAIAVYIIGMLLPEKTWLSLIWLGFSAFVLWLTLGPKDMFAQVADYLQAKRQHDEQRAQQLAKDILDQENPSSNRAVDVVDRILVAANDRYFAVIFWFILFNLVGAGPAGAMLYRGAEYLANHREVTRKSTTTTSSSDSSLRQAAIQFHDYLAWLPARLLAAIYPLFGNFHTGLQAWQKHLEVPSRRQPHIAEGQPIEYASRPLLWVGRGAIQLEDDKPVNDNQEVVFTRVSETQKKPNTVLQQDGEATVAMVETASRLAFYSLFFSLGLFAAVVAAGQFW